MPNNASDYQTNGLHLTVGQWIIGLTGYQVIGLRLKD